MIHAHMQTFLSQLGTLKSFSFKNRKFSQSKFYILICEQEPLTFTTSGKICFEL